MSHILVTSADTRSALFLRGWQNPRSSRTGDLAEELWLLNRSSRSVTPAPDVIACKVAGVARPVTELRNQTLPPV